jgi:predicted dehydrogenase
MRRVRTAVIGCGKVGRIHARALADLAESELVAVCDGQGERARDFAAQYGVLAKIPARCSRRRGWRPCVSARRIRRIAIPP